MTHIIILSHFVCITIGCILLYELLRNVTFRGKERFLVVGVGLSNLAFILDTINIYCRHWYKGYSLNTIVNVVCVLLFCFSIILLFLYLLQLGAQELTSQKRSSIIIGSVFLLCFIIQIISNYVDMLGAIPWACIGYLFFCGVQFTYLFGKTESESPHTANEEEVVVSTEKNTHIELLTERELEIANYICEGKSNKEIAEALFISQNTVRNHIYNIYRKLEVKNKIELINKLN